VLVTVPVVLLVFRAARRLSERGGGGARRRCRRGGGRGWSNSRARSRCCGPTRGPARAARDLLHEALAAQHRAARREVTGALPGLQLGQLAIQSAFTAVLVIGVLLATHGEVTPARAIALLVLGTHFLQPFAVVAGAAGSLRTCRAAIDRIDAVLSTPPLPEPVPGLPVGADASVELDGVRFGYGAGEPPVLDGFSLRIPAGTTTALVGASGAGKTTVTKLIARFFDVDAGTVLIGGTDVRELTTAALLDTVSLVFQDVYLVDGTIEENIRLGRPDATPERVRDAARRARADTIAARLPDGWATRVGEGGRLLSGGERQRVAIARTLLKDTPVVLLDEATSALDAENERAVHDALAETGHRPHPADHRPPPRHRRRRRPDRQSSTPAASRSRAPTPNSWPPTAVTAALWADHERTHGWRLTNSPSQGRT